MTVHADLSPRGREIDCLCQNAQPGDLYTWIPEVELTGLHIRQAVDCTRCLAISDKMVFGVSLARARAEVAAEKAGQPWDPTSPFLPPGAVRGA